MTEEIKEMNLSEMLFNRDERLLNYITNLQKENNQHISDIQVLMNKKENLERLTKKLQKENEKLKEENKRIFSRVNDDELLISNAMNYAELQDYKQRNEKAVEFVKSMEYCGQEDYFYDLKSKDPCGNDNTFNDSKYNLLNILEGGDE